MKKTTVYLPESLKSRLTELARSTGRSEAHLIRLAVRRLLASQEGRNPITEVPSDVPSPDRDDDRARAARPARLIGVGVGPGPADLLTTRALAALRSADVVAAPTTSEQAAGRAETIVRQALPQVVVHRLPFVMTPDRAVRERAARRAAEWVVRKLEDGLTVAFVTLGDPNVYSTFSRLASLVRQMRPDTPVETIPGIMAFQDLAARSGTVIAQGRESLRLVCGPFDRPNPLPVPADDETLVVYKGGEHLQRIGECGMVAARSAVAGELLGMPGERIGNLSEMRGPASYLTTVILPARRCSDGG